MVPPPQAMYPLQSQQQAAYSSGGGVYPSSGYTNTLSVSSIPPSAVPTPPLAGAGAVPAQADISALFQNLVKAGLVSAPPATHTKTTASAPAINMQSLSALSSLLATSGLVSKTHSESSSVVVDPRTQAEKAYEQMILNMDVSLTSAGMQR